MKTNKKSNGLTHIVLLFEDQEMMKIFHQEIKMKLNRLRSQDYNKKYSSIRIMSMHGYDVSIIYQTDLESIVKDYGLLDKIYFNDTNKPQFLFQKVNVGIFQHDMLNEEIQSLFADRDRLDRCICDDISKFKEIEKRREKIRRQYIFALNSEVEARMITDAIHNQLRSMKDYIEDNIILSTSYYTDIQNSQINGLKQLIGSEYIITLTIFESSSIDIIITGFETNSFFYDPADIKEIKVTAKTVAIN